MSPYGDLYFMAGQKIRKMSNKRQETSERLIKAVGDLVAEQGFASAGVNAIARQAGVDKVLIYRYFDGLDGLYTAFAQSADFWPSVSEILGDKEDYEQLKKRPFAEIMAEVFRRYIRAIRSRPTTQEILAWETVERNSLTIELEKVRERMALDLMAHMQTINAPEADWQAITNIFTGAIHYLIIRGRKIKSFSGMDIRDDEEWERMVSAIETLCHAVSASIVKTKNETN